MLVIKYLYCNIHFLDLKFNKNIFISNLFRSIFYFSLNSSLILNIYFDSKHFFGIELFFLIWNIFLIEIGFILIFWLKKSFDLFIYLFSIYLSLTNFISPYNQTSLPQTARLVSNIRCDQQHCGMLLSLTPDIWDRTSVCGAN